MMFKTRIRQLLKGFYHGQISGEEKKELEHLLANEDLADEPFLAGMTEIEKFLPLESVKYADFDVNTGFQKLKGVVSQDNADFRSPNKDQKKSNPLKTVLQVAAGVCILLLGVWLVHDQLDYKSNRESQSDHDWKMIETLRGQTRKITLADGTVIKLNVSSKIRFGSNFSKQPVRKVFLEGEAFFDVARIDSKPFVVVAKGVETTVLGTSFNIEAYQDNPEFKLAVVTGKVKVADQAGGDQIFLTPNEMITWGKGHIHKGDYDPDRVLAWIERSLVFKNDAIETVIKELEAWYDVEFVVNGTISSTSYTGVHHDEPLEVLMKGLSFAGGFEYKIEGKKVFVNTLKAK